MEPSNINMVQSVKPWTGCQYACSEQHNAAFTDIGRFAYIVTKYNAIMPLHCHRYSGQSEWFSP